jgi:hypothetical protein
MLDDGLLPGCHGLIWGEMWIWEGANLDDELGVIVVAAEWLRHSSIDAVCDFTDRGDFASQGNSPRACPRFDGEAGGLRQLL